MIYSFFVPGKLENFSNQKNTHWAVESRYRNGWHDRTSAAWKVVRPHQSRMPLPEAPKVIHFRAQVFNRFDSDGFSNSLKPIRDQLVKEGVIHADDTRSGHLFEYGEQTINRKNLGVFVTITTAAGG